MNDNPESIRCQGQKFIARNYYRACDKPAVATIIGFLGSQYLCQSCIDRIEKEQNEPLIKVYFRHG
jgi:hypothetical protein